ncbi:MAG: GDP-mannose 4,6-dehydratase [Thaumarchaeota archaeon]|nr:GDP-mannose 4,6-dehydratase [Candidatus Calditenuaceae archaeon]
MTRRFLVTGASGFIGRNLVEALVNEYPQDEFHLLYREDKFLDGIEQFISRFEGVNIHTHKCDIRNEGDLDDVIREAQPNLTIHMAAITPVRYSWERPKEYMEVNYFGTINLLQSLSKLSLITRKKHFIIFYSTPEVLGHQRSYSNYLFTQFTEMDHAYPTSPYAASKLAAESYVRYQKNVPGCIVRPANTFDRTIIGKNEEARGYFVEKAIIQLLTKGQAEFDGNPHVLRTWIHVSDHVGALMQIVREYVTSSPMYFPLPIYHLAPLDERALASCQQVVDMVAKIIGLDHPKIEWGKNVRPWDPHVLIIKGEGYNYRYKYPWKDLYSGLRMAVMNWKRVLGIA